MVRQTIPAGPRSGNTRDIINAIARALPVAVAQIEKRNNANPGGPINRQAQNIAKYTRRNFKYVKDGLKFQDIKLPSALEATKTGDCKSLSLYIAAQLTALNITNGLRFAAYGTTDPTHVYNWYLDENKKLHTLDACLDDLKESPRYTKIEDMQTRIIAGVPVLSEMYELGGPRRDARRERRQERREDRQERREQRREEGKGFFQVGKKIALAPARGAFLLVVRANFLKLAAKLSKAPADKLRGFWGKLGGDIDKLNAAINAGKDKKAPLGLGNPDFIGVDPITAAAATSAPILLAVKKFLSDIGIDAEDITAAVKKIAPGAQPLGDFQASDPETTESAALTKTIPGQTPESPIGFKISPLLIAGGLAAAYFLTRKKGRK
jgi:hypothetical protein